jgi:DNA-binding MarR family transcriptional regulator
MLRYRNILNGRKSEMKTSNDSPLSDQVFHQLLTFQHNVRCHARQLADESDLTPREFSVLRFLLEIGSATVGEIQAFIHRSLSTTSMLIAQLEEKGRLTRTRSQEDNRVVIVQLTPEGREIAERTPMEGMPLLRRRLGTLPEPRLLEMLGILNEIVQLMEVSNTE